MLPQDAVGAWTPPESEELIRLLLGIWTDHAFFLLDGAGRVASWNDGAERLLGYPESEILRQEHSFFYRPEDRQRGIPTQQLQMAAQKGQASREDWLIAKEGRTFWASVSIRSLRNVDGRLYGFAQAVRDLSEWQRLQEKQQEAERRFRGIFDQTFEYVGLLRSDGTLVDINQPALDFRGLLRADVVGRPLWDSPWLDVAPEARTWVRHAVAQAAGGTICRDELTMLGADSRPRTFDFSLKPIYGDTGQVTLLIAEARDITERKRLEAQYLQAQKMEAIGQLAGGVAHDFNNILTAISGYGELLLRVCTDAMGRELVGEVLKASERAAALTRQLLAFSRKALIEPRVLDLNALVIDLEKMLTRIIGEHITLMTQLQPTLGRVKADPGQLEQVILNLVINARDAMAEGGGKVILETRNVELDEDYARQHTGVQAGRYVLLAVSDTGSGMTPEVQTHLFEPFFTTKDKSQGTGLGLATVYGILQQAGGHIAVYSEPGIGTTMKVYLPRVLGAGLATESQAKLGTIPRGDETVLLVEDDEAVRALARLVLTNSGYTVLDAHNGETALSIAAQRTDAIQVLVTDVVMPGMDGRTLASRLQALHPEIKVLYLSGYTADAVVRHGILQEQMLFLQKPFAAAALARKVREVIDSTTSG
jgi:PAS domain S-box-containing protein